MKNSADVNIHSLKDFLSVLAIGEKRKKFAETKMNEHSSRAHTIIIVNVLQKLNKDKNNEMFSKSKLFMVDLAGCEQIKKSEVEGVHLKEAIKINQSLLVLGKCISALVKNVKHVPY